MKKIVLFGFILSTISISLTSCYQDPEPGVAVVVVLDANEFKVPSATVTLSQPGQNGNGIILVTGFTDISGKFAYTHEPALEVILNIAVAKDNKSGQGVIRVKPDETTTEEVTIY